MHQIAYLMLATSELVLRLHRKDFHRLTHLLAKCRAAQPGVTASAAPSTGTLISPIATDLIQIS